MLNDIIRKNIYIYNHASKLSHYKRNQIVARLIDDVVQNDSIQDYESFAEIIKEYKAKYGNDYIFINSCYYANSLLYGHLNALYKYAEIKDDIDYYALSNVEHGTFVDTNGIEKNKINLHNNTLLMGNYKTRAIHRVNPLKPVFVIGPYIYYADSYYSEKRIEELKGVLGKTLLVFPSHSYEACDATYEEEKLVKYVMGTAAKGFNTVIVCVYWNDVSQRVFEMFKAAGAKLVSCGFRGDPQFIERQKTLFLLADEVCGNSFGTHIGYTIFMKKKFRYFNTNITLETNEKDVTSEEVRKIDDLHQWVKECFENNEVGELSQSQMARYESLWGGEKALKSKADIADIIYLGKQIIKESKGNTEKFDDVVKQLVEGNNLAERQKDLLNNALRDD